MLFEKSTSPDPSAKTFNKKIYTYFVILLIIKFFEMGCGDSVTVSGKIFFSKKFFPRNSVELTFLMQIIADFPPENKSFPHTPISKTFNKSRIKFFGNGCGKDLFFKKGFSRETQCPQIRKNQKNYRKNQKKSRIPLAKCVKILYNKTVCKLTNIERRFPRVFFMGDH